MSKKDFEPCPDCVRANLECPHHDGSAIVTRNGEPVFYRNGVPMLTRASGYIDFESIRVVKAKNLGPSTGGSEGAQGGADSR